MNKTKKYNKVKPTEKQTKTFMHMKKAKTLQEAMLAGGYSKKTALMPKANFLDREGVKPLIEQYRTDLINAGITTEILAEIQAEGLFDQDARVRLEYIKETKKDIGLLNQQDSGNVKKRVIAEDFFRD